MAEEWRPSLHGAQVSNLGRVRGVRGWILKATPNKAGYPEVNLRMEPGAHYLVHTLVLLAFVGPCPEGMEALHGNGDPQDNRPENLRWGTRAENEADKVAHGTSNRGERQGGHRLTEAQVREIRASTEPGIVLAARYGVSTSTISKVRHRKNWGWLA